MSRDNIYAKKVETLAPFQFDSKVVEVFDDMIRRSVPGYGENIPEMVALAQGAAVPRSTVYDLGCSLGAFLIPFAREMAKSTGRDTDVDIGSPGAGIKIVGVDSSKDMLDGLRSRSSGLDIKLICDSIQNTEIVNASVVVLNYTLQFIPLVDRNEIVMRIAHGTRKNGILLLSEKIQGPTPHIDELYVDRHHVFKRESGYSELEIAQKRQSLENVLIAEPIETHLTRLNNAGYRDVGVWFQCHNFVSFYARK